MPLRPKTFEVLRHLAERAGRLVPRESLMRAVWPDVFVTGDSITQCIAEIRRALGDEGARFLRTLPKRGYLLIVEPARAGGAPPPGAVAAPTTSRPGRLRRRGPAGADGHRPPPSRTALRSPFCRSRT